MTQHRCTLAVSTDAASKRPAGSGYRNKAYNLMSGEQARACLMLVSTVDAKAFTGVGISATCELKILQTLQLKLHSN
jgi:hypothetical protein